MGIAQDHIDRVSQLATSRTEFDRAWKQVRQVAAPDASDFTNAGLGLLGGSRLGLLRPEAAKNSVNLYDTTAINAVERLGAGIEAIVCPQSEYWHGLDVTDYTGTTLTQSEKVWLERHRNLLFETRYDADSGFVPANQTAIRRTVAFGNAFKFVEESFDGRSMIKYRYLPIAECYIATDAHDTVNAWYRVYELTADQASREFNGNVSSQVKTAANNPTQKDQRFTFVHCISASGDYGDMRSPVNRSPWRSMHIEVESKHVCKQSGYYTFPVIDFRWLPEPGRVYGEGPVMKVLADIQSANKMAKNEMLAGEQSVAPPLLVADAGVMNRPDARPNGITFGGMSANGQRRVEPLFAQQRLDFHTMVLEAKRNGIKESLYINLFATLVQNPQMSATEALIRANEKGELLGPAGTRFQGGYSRMIDREIDILARRGLYEPRSYYAVPRRFGGKRIKVQFTSPLDRMRKAKQGQGTLQLIQTLTPLAQVDPSIVDNFEPDTMTRGLADIFNVPAEFLRDEKVVAQRRQARAQAQEQANQMAMMQQMADATKSGADALATTKEAGVI